MFDEQPDGDPHGECAREIRRLESDLAAALKAYEVQKCINEAESRDLAAAQAVLPCGHHPSLMLKSAETGEPLYCELCDCISGRNDAEKMEAEARAEAAALRVDAERYRALRTYRGMDHDPDFAVMSLDQDVPLWGVELDAAIDQARKENDNG